MILLVFVSSASAADTNTTDVLSVDEPTSTVNEKLALDYSSDTSGEYIITSSYNGANIANKITITE